MNVSTVCLTAEEEPTVFQQVDCWLSWANRKLREAGHGPYPGDELPRGPRFLS